MYKLLNVKKKKLVQSSSVLLEHYPPLFMVSCLTDPLLTHASKLISTSKLPILP